MSATRPYCRTIFALVFFAALGTLAFGDPPDPAGHWEGAISVGGKELKIVLDLTKGDEGWTGKIGIPAQGLTDSPVKELVVDGTALSFQLPAPTAKPNFKGTVSEDGQSIAGTLTQGELKATFNLNRISAEELAARALRESQIKLDAMWLGTLKVSGTELRLFLKVYTDPEGKFFGKLDSVDQGARNIDLPSITIEGNRFAFDLKSFNAAYEGTFNEARTEIAGQWTQGTQKLPLTFAKTDQPFVLRRPQEPKPPYRYATEEVSYENQQAGVRLAGTLTLPRGKGPFPAVILITGSGAQDRNESLMGHKPFLVLADHLTRQGIAVLRSDDRGVGGSTGKVQSSTTEDFAGDVESAIAFLKTRSDIDPHKIGLLGHSEGGVIAPMVAARSADVAFIVMIAAPGLPGEDIIYSQTRLLAKAAGSTPETIESAATFERSLFAIVKEEKDPAAAEKAVRDKIASLSDAEKKALNLNQGSIDAQVTSIVSPWFRFFLTYDPRTALRKVHCPVLALNGSFDLQVASKENLAAISEALKEAGNKDYRAVELERLNHLLQTANTGSPAEYGVIEETISDIALDLISVWIKEHTMPQS